VLPERFYAVFISGSHVDVALPMTLPIDPFGTKGSEFIELAEHIAR
jgi:hypothetical protein